MTQAQSIRRLASATRTKTTRTGVRDTSRATDGKLSRAARLNKLVVPAFALNLLIVVGLFTSQGGFADLGTTAAKLNTAGRLTGLIATNLCLVQLLLMGRNPWLDRTFGMDKLAKWHRIVGHTSFHFIVAHVVLITIGYAKLSQISILAEVPQMVLHTRDILMATAAFICFVLIVFTSIKIARKRMRYESWYYVHLYAYVGIALAVPHQIYTGADFASSQISQGYWLALYVLTVGSLLLFRVGLPLRSAFRYRLRVAHIYQENHEIVSIYITGRNLDRLQAESGQFFIWRFLAPGQWWQAHPYSLSAAPPSGWSAVGGNEWLRITVKDLGKGSADLINLRVGTRVFASGPYGAFTAARRTNRRVLLVAGGVGITPIRALLESIPARDGDITVIYRARDDADLVLLDEVNELAARRSATVHVILGSRSDYPRNRQPLGPKHLTQMVPELAEHDVYICGPEHLTTRVCRALARVGMSKTQIHYETFAF